MTLPADVRTIVAIPARLHSTRLPGKVLLPVEGKSLLHRVFEVAVAARCGPVVVLTDDDEVAAEVDSFGGDVILTSPQLDSGTARIAAVIDELEGDIVVNLQGDAPLTDPAILRESVAEAARSGAVTLPVYPLEDEHEIRDPNVVKVVRAHDGGVLYCSRSPVPHVRDSDLSAWPARHEHWGHLGIYAYPRTFLETFPSLLEESPLERAERLEQLRWLESGVRLHSFEVTRQGPSVDTAEQLEVVRAAFRTEPADTQTPVVR